MWSPRDHATLACDQWDEYEVGLAARGRAECNDYDDLLEVLSDEANEQEVGSLDDDFFGEELEPDEKDLVVEDKTLHELIDVSMNASCSRQSPAP